MEGKVLYIEVLRIIACFMVIFVHTVDDGIMIFTKYVPNTFPYWFYLFIASIFKGGVVCFWMISGALLLDKEENLKDIFKKRIFKTVVVLLTFLMFYYVVDLKYVWQKIDLLKFTYLAYTGNLEASLWYLYAYIALLFTLPLQKRLVKNLDNWHYIYISLFCI